MDVTLDVGQVFPAGTVVGAYPRSDWQPARLPPEGAPPGAAEDTSAVAANGSLTLTVTPDLYYFAGAEVGGAWRYVAFRAGQDIDPSQDNAKRSADETISGAWEFTNLGLVLPADVVDAAQISANAVGASELADNAVDTAAIANGAVTAEKVAADVATQAELDAVAMTWPLDHTGATAATNALTLDVSGDSVNRFIADHDGKLEWGPGNAAIDTNLYRSAANVLKTDDALSAVGVIKASVGSASEVIVGDLSGFPHVGFNDVVIYRSSAAVLTVTGGFTTFGKVAVGTELEIDGALNHDGTTVGFYGKAPVAQAADCALVNRNVTAIGPYGFVNVGDIGAMLDNIDEIRACLRNVGLMA